MCIRKLRRLENAQQGCLVRCFPAIIVILTLIQGCGAMAEKNSEGRRGQRYFTSPEQAVEVARKLLLAEDYPALADYYDLSGSDVDRDELERGEFFVRKQKPEVVHPGGFWRTKHPFSPGFELHSVQPTGRAKVHRVVMTITIDQGIDTPAQEGMSHFHMIESVRGWQILPPADGTGG
jgi:hypothetical protein